MPPVKKYGHISRKTKGGQGWRWVLVALIGLWRLVVLT
jgi:hypothetical protein